MICIFKSRTTIILLSVIILIALVFTIYNTNFTNNITYVNYVRIADVEDERVLAGIAHNIFVGKVIFEAGNKKLGKMPETQFTVQVLENIKGDLNGNVVVNQQGGKKGNITFLVENDKLIEAGKMYLFATCFNDSEKWNTIIPQYGNIGIVNEINKLNLIDKFKKAFKEQIEYDLYKKAPNIEMLNYLKTLR